MTSFNPFDIFAAPFQTKSPRQSCLDQKGFAFILRPSVGSDFAQSTRCLEKCGTSSSRDLQLSSCPGSLVPGQLQELESSCVPGKLAHSVGEGPRAAHRQETSSAAEEKGLRANS